MGITRRSAVVAFLIIFAMLSVLAMPIAVADEVEIGLGWHMADGDARHTSQSSYYVTHVLSQQKWELNLPMSTEMVVGDDGSMYVGLSNNSIASIDQDGNVRWFLQLNGEVRNAPAISADGTVYCMALPTSYLLGFSPGLLYAINPDGVILHRYDVPYISATSSPVIDGDHMLIYTVIQKQLIGKTIFSNQIWCFDLDLYSDWTYSETFTTTSESYFYSSTPEPAVGPDGSISVIFNRTLLHLSADGEKLWNFDPGFLPNDSNTWYQQRSPVMIDDRGRIIMGFEDFGYCFWPNGTLSWKHHFISNSILPLALDSDQIIFTDGQRIISLRYNGDVSWSGNHEGYYISRADLATSRVLVIPDYDSILLFNANGNFGTETIDCADDIGIMEDAGVCYATLVQNNTICYQKFGMGQSKIVCLGLSEANDNIASANVLSDTQTVQLFLVIVIIASLTFAVSLVVPKKKVPKQ